MITSGMNVPLELELGRSSADRYDALFGVSQAIGAHRDPKKLFSVLADELRNVVDFCLLTVLLYDEKTKTMRPHVSEGAHSALGDFVLQEFAPEETLAWWAYRHQQPLVIPCVDEESRFPRMMAFLKRNHIRSVCCLPLATSQTRLGGFSIGSEHPDAYCNDINRHVHQSRRSWLDGWMTKLAFRHLLRKRAYTRERFDQMAQQSRFGTC